VPQNIIVPTNVPLPTHLHFVVFLPKKWGKFWNFFSSVNSSNFDKCFGKICKNSDIKKLKKRKEKESLTMCYHFNFGH
jgi:hypothetical protein